LDINKIILSTKGIKTIKGTLPSILQSQYLNVPTNLVLNKSLEISEHVKDLILGLHKIFLGFFRRIINESNTIKITYQ